MQEPKIKVNKTSVKKFLSTIKDMEKHNDCFVISDTMEKILVAV